MGVDIIRLMDHLAIKRAHIVGFSLGGTITVQLLTQNPTRFLTVTLIGGAGRRLPYWTSANDEVDEAQARELEETPAINNDTAALASMVRAKKTLVVSADQVEALNLPILAIVGTADSALASVLDFKRQKPQIEMLIVEGAVHGPPSDPRAILRQAQTLDGLRSFLRRQH
jgi:pimeloyl-ACP methyl ester carboxylesterase